MSWSLKIMDANGTLQSTITDATSPPVMMESPTCEVDPPGDCVTMTLHGRPDQLNVAPRGILQYAENGVDLFWGSAIALPSSDSLGAGPADSDSDSLERYTIAGGRQLVDDSAVKGYLLGGDTLTISNATNATPIQITTTSAHHLVTGQRVVISGVAGNTAANGTWTATVVDASNFTLDGSAGDGTYTGSGAVSPAGADAPMDVSDIAFALCVRYAHPALTVNSTNFPASGRVLSTFYEPERRLSDALDDLTKTIAGGATWWVDSGGQIHFEAN